MKRLDTLKIIFASFAIPYSFMAFTLWQWNPSLWDWYERFIVALFIFTFWSISYVLFGETYDMKIDTETNSNQS